MKNSPLNHPAFWITVTAWLAAGMPQKAAANTELWVGVAGTSTTTNWSDNANWSNLTGGGGAGPNGNDVVFGDPGAIGAANTVNTVVDQNLLNPFSLTFTNNSGTSKFHTLLIPAGVSVTNANGLTVGINGAALSYLTTVNFTGPGTFVQNGSLTVKNASTTSSGGVLPFLDMSGLSNFVLNASAATLTVAGSGGDARGSGRLDLASGTNSITVGTITVANATGNGGLGGTLNLGAGTNIINVGTLNLAGGKVNNATMKFLGATGGLRMRGVGGTDNDRVTMLFANRNNTGSGSPNGTMDLTGGHVVDVKAGTITLGQCTGSNPGSAQGTSATLKFDAGKLDATNINLAVNSQANVTSTGNLIVGSGGSVLVNNISLVNQTGGTGVGNLSFGGVVICSNSIAKTSTVGTGNITMTNGTLILLPGAAVGAAANPIDNVTMSDSTNNLNPGSTAVITVNNLTTGGAGNLINISSLPVITSYPKQFPLISFAGAIGGNGFNYALGTLPAGSPAYQGYISNNVSSVDLVLTNGPTPVGLAIWNGTINSNWDLSGTLNWTNLGVAASFHNGDAVKFDDTATGPTNVNLTASLQPGSVLVTNNTKTYTFSGVGKISGGTGLTKIGSNTLILDHSGTNDFIGAVTISAGTLQVGNNDANGNLPAVSVQDDAALVFSRNDNVILPNVISGVGSLAQIGSGKLTLTGANEFTGNTTVRNGTLALNGAGSISNSPLVAVSSAGTFDVSGIASAPFYGNAVTLTNGTLALGTNTAGIGLLSASNSTISLMADANAVTLVATNLVAGGATNLLNITAVANVPSSPALPVVIPLVAYSSGTFNGGFNFGETGFPNAYVSNDVATSTIYLVLTAEPYLVTWNGGSSTGSFWSDAANWTGVDIGALDALVFDGAARVNNTNNTAAGTAYTNLTFNSGAGAFTLNGNAISLGGGIVNNSANPQTILLGISYNGSRALDGAGGPLILGGGISNALTVGTATLTFAGTGILTNMIAGGTNLFLLNDPAANWTLLDNAASTPVTVPTAFAINNGTFNFGSATSAPKLTSTTPQGAPQDNQIGIAASATGTFNMSNGTFTTSARMNTGVGGNATGVVNLSGGTLNVASQFQGANGAATAFSTVNISGGTMNIGSVATPTGTFFVASRGNGTLTISGGVLNCGTLDTSRNAAGNTGGSIGTVNLNGGLLTCTAITNISANAQAGGTPTAQINFNGGTLKARANFNYYGSTATPAIPITSLVQAGGAIIDTTNFNLNFLEPLQTDPALAGVPDGGLLKLGSGTLTMAAANTYIGNTVVSNGTLNVSGSLAQTAVRVAGGTLSGAGNIGSNVIVQAAGTVSPAGSGTVGTLTITGNLLLQGVAAMDINQASAASDNLNVSGAVTYGGTLAITNLSGTLTTNDTFTLFTAGSRSGAFAAITPASPGVGLAWNTNTLVADGILRLAIGVNTTPTNMTSSLSGNVLTLSWPADHIGWRLLVQTNALNTGLNLNTNAWFTVPGSAAVNTETITLDTAKGTIFYRMVYP